MYTRLSNFANGYFEKNRQAGRRRSGRWYIQRTSWIKYPFLPEGPQYTRAKKYLKGEGVGMGTASGKRCQWVTF